LGLSPGIAQQIALAFSIEIDKDVVSRLLSLHYRPESDPGGPSWLTFLGHMKDSLWSCDLFRCESATLRTYWVLVVMDQATRRIIGFGVHSGMVDGVALCRVFHRAVRGHTLPKDLSSDHDPLYRFINRRSRFVPIAKALSRVVSNGNRGVILSIRPQRFRRDK
jgi:putative transposase